MKKQTLTLLTMTLCAGALGGCFADKEPVYWGTIDEAVFNSRGVAPSKHEALKAQMKTPTVNYDDVMPAVKAPEVMVVQTPAEAIVQPTMQAPEVTARIPAATKSTSTSGKAKMVMNPSSKSTLTNMSR